jgi:hypothetical protein
MENRMDEGRPFIMPLYGKGDWDEPQYLRLDAVTLVKEEGPLFNTRITGLCTK